MNNMKRKIAWTISAIALMVMCCPVIAFAADGAEEYVPNMYASFWALIPPVVAIALALITKEVYSSLFIGIVIGGVFYSKKRLHMLYRTDSSEYWLTVTIWVF